MTKNFNISEFQCSCGCLMPDDVRANVEVLAWQLQILRDYIEVPIHITNAYRCAKHNSEVGGVKNSQHLYGKAADLQIKHISPDILAKTIESLISQDKMLEGGIGIYRTFTHYDIRLKKARWDFT